MIKNILYRIILLVFSTVSISGSIVVASDTIEYFKMGVKYFEQGKISSAIELLEQAIELNPNFAEAYNYLGLAYRETDMDLQEVAWYFKIATDIKPDYAEAYVNLARAYYGFGQFDNAEKYLHKALDVDPHSGNAQLSLAWTYLLGLQQPQKAIVYFQKILDRSEIPYAYFGLGIAYFMNDQKPLVLEIITNLRMMEQDQLAKQLEDIVRGHRYSPAAMGPLVNRQAASQTPKGIIVPSKIKEKDVKNKEDDSAPVEGMMRIRLRGSLMNPGDVELDGEPTIISPEERRLQRIRELQKNRSDY